MKRIMCLCLVLLFMVGCSAGVDKDNQKTENSDPECSSKIDCTSIVDVRTPHHACSVENGCAVEEGKCVSICDVGD